MHTHKINLSFDVFNIQNVFIAATVKKAIYETLFAENVTIPCEINVLITNDSGIRLINSTTRNIDKPTDVLSFPMFQLKPGIPPTDIDKYTDLETGLCPLGDMVISLERASVQAKEFGHSLRREIGYLTIHSILHLLGYDHMDEGLQKAQMRSREEAIASSIAGMKR